MPAVKNPRTAPRTARTPRTRTNRNNKPAAPTPAAPKRLTMIADTKALIAQLAPFGALLSRVQPIFAHHSIIISAAAGKVRAFGTDQETALEVALEQVDVTSDGSIAVPVGLLLETLKKSTAVTVNIAAKDDEVVNITDGLAVINLRGRPVSELPKFPTIKPQSKIRIAPEDLSKTLDQVMYCICTEHSRYAINGVQFDMKRSFRCAATDGRRLALATCPHKGGRFPATIVPITTCAVINKLAAQTEDQITIEFSGQTKQIAVSGGNWKVIAKQLDGTFPPFESVIPKESQITVTVDRAALLAAIKQSAVVVEDSSLRLSFTSKGVKLGANDQPGDSDVQCEVESFKGDEITIGAKPRQLTDVLSHLPEKAQLRLTAPNKPMRFDGNRSIHLLMPTSLN